jgi:hypothetical protein
MIVLPNNFAKQFTAMLSMEQRTASKQKAHGRA